MLRRLFDIMVCLIALVILFPVLLFAAIGVRLSSPGPILYMAKRIGLHGKPFIMYKFRTMNEGASSHVITDRNDERIFPFGHFLRKTKIDELPQLLNVLRGDMVVVGPRPEDPQIVEMYYTTAQMITLQVPPGLASPGSIFNYTHGDLFLNGDDAVEAYVKRLLPIKLMLETHYVMNRSLSYDLEIVFRTIAVIFQITCGRKKFPLPREYGSASCTD